MKKNSIQSISVPKIPVMEFEECIKRVSFKSKITVKVQK